MKWTEKLSEFDILFKTRTAIKGRDLVDFVAEFTNIQEMERKWTPSNLLHLFVDWLFEGYWIRGHEWSLLA